jgi:DNA-binding response OmpR family regulator
MEDGTVQGLRHAVPQILLVDDEEDILPEYQDFLELEGFNSAICSNPEEAAQIVLDYPSIGLVITDLRMAKLDGASLIRRLRSMLPQGRRVEFIILTGDPRSHINNDIADIPVFIKPADTDALIAEVKSALAQTR